MTKRRRLFIAATIAAVTTAVIAGVVIARLPPRQRCCREAFERVVVGMSRDEAIQAVGVPPGEYAIGRVLRAPRSIWWWGDEAWVCDDCELAVWYGPDGRVKDARITDVMNFAEPTLFERIREWIGV